MAWHISKDQHNNICLITCIFISSCGWFKHNVKTVLTLYNVRCAFQQGRNLYRYQWGQCFPPNIQISVTLIWALFFKTFIWPHQTQKDTVTGLLIKPPATPSSIILETTSTAELELDCFTWHSSTALMKLPHSAFPAPPTNPIWDPRPFLFWFLSRASYGVTDETPSASLRKQPSEAHPRE